ncbi:glycogen-binding subunit 76A isoform X2 [Achroia grisella]|uniref:glycogen-binding subunit 76A isoform X2 n=1 Tax=Achroia grisella TaxID=688607 RepID=UPI0027D247C2|nr:glycogen-binding subunit 76A isoform X2 [Achroia grisella]
MCVNDEMDLRTQMSNDHSVSQCGLTSLLPMSCRGRAVAFARDLHSRLRNLGGGHDEHCENNWLSGDNTAHRPTTSTQRDHDTFYDFELECESPSSPVDEYDPPFPEQSSVRSTNDEEQPFYDVDSETNIKEQMKLVLHHPDKIQNGFKFSTVFFTESPVKLQQSPRENGHADKRLFSPITFEDCGQHNSFDKINYVGKASPTVGIDRLSLPEQLSVNLDSDSEFESARSDPSDCIEEVFHIDKYLNNDVIEEDLSVTEIEYPNESDILIETNEAELPSKPVEIITSEVPIEKEISPAPEIEPRLLSAEIKDEDNDDVEDDRPQRVRRCSSLKTGKTPPGTPGRKKIVRFADVLGLDLADVKTFMDEIPVIPKSAYDDLTGCDMQNSPPVRSPLRLGTLTLVPLFQLARDVADKLEIFNVCLESARVCDGVHVTVCGSVRVRNLDFHKTVHIRYTMNRWITYTDLQTSYVQGSCDGYSDRFQFVLYAPSISSGQRLELAVRFQCKGQQFWDNNSGANYCFDCLALGLMPLQASPGPLHPTVDWHPSFY